MEETAPLGAMTVDRLVVGPHTGSGVAVDIVGIGVDTGVGMVVVVGTGSPMPVERSAQRWTCCQENGPIAIRKLRSDLRVVAESVEGLGSLR